LTRATRCVKDAHANGKGARIDKKAIQAMSSYSYVGIFFGVAIAICLFAGNWIDTRFHTKPWFTLVGALLGVATGFVELYRVSKKALRNRDT
jgi:ATP synthase protein I